MQFPTITWIKPNIRPFRTRVWWMTICRFLGLAWAFLPSINLPAAEPISSPGNEPIFELWQEDNVYGNLNVAMDGTVLLFSLQGDPHPDKRRGSKIYLKRSVDGGATWSDHQLIGKRIDLDWKALGIGPYDGKGWGRDKHHSFATLGTTVVDEDTGEIMLFLTALYPAPLMYKSKDHGKSWSLEKVDFAKDGNGFLSIPNAACDPGINIQHGKHKGRLLVPSRVMVNYNKQEEGKGYTNAIYSDDHGKSWKASDPFPLDGTGESGLVELKDGTIYLNSRTHTRTGNRWIAYSDDSGETWRDLRQDDELFDGPPDQYGCKAGLLRLKREDRDILLFSSPDPDLPKRRNIRVWISFDGGNTWPHNRLIKRGPGNYTWMTQGRTGTPSEGFIYLLSGKDWMARFNLAWLLKTEDSNVLLSQRAEYRFSDPDLYESAENAEPFTSEKTGLQDGSKGFRLTQDHAKGHVVTHPMILPSAEMKVSYHAPHGKLFVWILDESGARVGDSHALSGPLAVDQPVPWQDGPIDQWVGKKLSLQFMLEGDAEIFDISFDDASINERAANTAAVNASDHRFVLPPRNDYLLHQTPPFIKSTENVTAFNITDESRNAAQTAYKLEDTGNKGRILSHQISLPSEKMKISCDVSSGNLTVSILDADGKLLATSQTLKGGRKIKEPVTWPSTLQLHEYVSRPVTFRFDLEGEAEIHAIRFDDLFWE
ncbi:MAG: exo-alpha-sialidase [Planctomycetaceae bacterium]|nr:exo-alpha-sialidase [Planctomycetaceae bacterium]